jgi:hypothetical protein
MSRSAAHRPTWTSSVRSRATRLHGHDVDVHRPYRERGGDAGQHVGVLEELLAERGIEVDHVTVYRA